MSELTDAIIDKNITAVIELLEKGLKPSTLAMEIASTGNTQILKTILEHDVNNIRVSWDNGYGTVTPKFDWKHIKHENKAIIQDALEKTAGLSEAILEGYTARTNELLTQYDCEHIVQNNYIQNAALGNKDEILNLLVEKCPSEVNSHGYLGRLNTPLAEIVFNSLSNYNAAKVLLEHGASLDAEVIHGKTINNIIYEAKNGDNSYVSSQMLELFDSFMTDNQMVGKCVDSECL